FREFIQHGDTGHDREAIVTDFPDDAFEPLDLRIEALGKSNQALLLALFAGHAVFAAIDLNIDLGHRPTPPSAKRYEPFPSPLPDGARLRERYHQDAWRGPRFYQARWQGAHAHARDA